MPISKLLFNFLKFSGSMSGIKLSSVCLETPGLLGELLASLNNCSIGSNSDSLGQGPSLLGSLDVLQRVCELG